MGKYPADITDEENMMLKFPFLQTEQYESVSLLPDGPLVLIRKSQEELTNEDIARMVEINREIAARNMLKKRD